MRKTILVTLILLLCAPAGASSISMTADQVFAIRISAQGPEGLYRFDAREWGQDEYTMLRDYSQERTFLWQGAREGTYELVTHAIIDGGYQGQYMVYGEIPEPPKPEPPVSATPKVIHSTDLFYPHEDFDDVIDLMTLVSLHKAEEIELYGVLLDNPSKQVSRPGATYISRLNAVTGQSIRHTPHSSTLLQWLAESPEPVTVTMVGSLTHLWQAYQADPALCKAKIKEVWVFAGEAQEHPARTHPRGREWYSRGLEYNVSLDVPAFMGIMDSDLPIVWIPCYDGGLLNSPADGHNMTHGSYHRNTYGSIFGGSSQAAKDFVVDGLRACIHYPRTGVTWGQVASIDKSLFGAGIFRAIGRPGGDYPFTFVDVNIEVNSNGTIGRRAEGKTIKMFQREADFYNRMSILTGGILSNL